MLAVLVFCYRRSVPPPTSTPFSGCIWVRGSLKIPSRLGSGPGCPPKYLCVTAYIFLTLSTLVTRQVQFPFSLQQQPAMKRSRESDSGDEMNGSQQEIVDDSEEAFNSDDPEASKHLLRDIKSQLYHSLEQVSSAMSFASSGPFPTTHQSPREVKLKRICQLFCVTLQL